LAERKCEIGKISVYDKRGYAYLPRIIRNEIGLIGKGVIPFYVDANCVLLISEDATKFQILKGIKILKENLMVRWKEKTRSSGA
jgi:hypothetical protein